MGSRRTGQPEAPMITARFVVVAIMATLLGLSAASAAGLGITPAALGAGDSPGSSCDAEVTVSWGPVVWEPSIPGYRITTVTLSGIGQSACKKAELRLQLTKAGGGALGEEK